MFRLVFDVSYFISHFHQNDILLFYDIIVDYKYRAIELKNSFYDLCEYKTVPFSVFCLGKRNKHPGGVDKQKTIGI